MKTNDNTGRRAIVQQLPNDSCYSSTDAIFANEANKIERMPHAIEFGKKQDIVKMTAATVRTRTERQ